MYSALGYGILTYVGSLVLMCIVGGIIYGALGRKATKGDGKVIAFISFLLGLAVFLINV